MEFGGQEKLRALKGGGTLGQVDGRFLLAGRCGIYMPERKGRASQGRMPDNVRWERS